MIKRYRYIFLGLALLAVLVVVFVVTGGNDIKNPSRQINDENPLAGIEYSVLYEHGQLYEFLDNSEVNLRLIQEDMALFARKTIPALADSSTLLGFTFTGSPIIQDGVFNQSGKFYGCDDTISIKVTDLGSGKISLSITDLANNVNIDSELHLGGKRSELLQNIPIKTKYYAIRYVNNSDKILVIFYEGFNRREVDKAIKIIKDVLQDSYDENDIIFSINAIGSFPLAKVYQLSDIPNLHKKFQTDQTIIY